jgi:acyl-CoA synthetase (AMP-forming)/AMP-acid ligase II
MSTGEGRLAALAILHRSRLLRPAGGPAGLLRLAGVFRRWGLTPAAGYAAQAALRPSAPALVDEAGALTFREMEERTTALARGLAERGVGPGVSVALLCRNHRGFVEASVATWKLGATTIYLNTSFAAPELAAVLERERPALLVHDSEFEPVAAPAPVRRLVAWEGDPAGESLEGLIRAQCGGGPLQPPPRPGRAVILTSGTTGRPKGARRPLPAGLEPALALLSRIPLRARETTLIAAPLFHAWGFAHLILSLLLGSTLVLQRRFDPERTLEALERHRVEALVAVPVMLQRMLELPPEIRRRYDISSLRVTAVSGEALLGDLAIRFMDAFGDVLYNLYGSTEVGFAAVATPEEMRRWPGTAGRPPRGTRLRLLDPDGREVAPGETGRIFVRSHLLFDGYTGGEERESRDGFLATGDLGRLDAGGLLFVEGRDDDMIVSGGENVYPQEVEDLLSRHPDVLEVAVVGVPDPEFGQALRAYVVPRPGARLDAEAVREHVRANLARYKVPRSVVFTDRLPRTASGKVLRAQLLAGGG